MPVQPLFSVIGLLEELSRFRPLTHAEADYLAVKITRQRSKSRREHDLPRLNALTQKKAHNGA